MMILRFDMITLDFSNIPYSTRIEVINKINSFEGVYITDIGDINTEDYYIEIHPDGWTKLPTEVIEYVDSIAIE